MPEMSLLSRFFNVFRKKSLDREFDEELRFHLDGDSIDMSRTA